METIPTRWNNEQKKLFIKQNDSKVKVTTKESLKYLYKVFRILGIYMNQDYKFAYFCYSLIFNSCSTLFLPISFLGSLFMKSNKSLDYFTLFSNIQVSINVHGSSTKICMLIYLIPKLISAEKTMAKLDERCVSKDEVVLLEKLKKLGRRLVFGFLAVYWSYSTSTFITSVMAGHPPYSIYLPGINWRHSKWEFMVASFIEWILMSVACFQQVANDAYAAIYVCILRTHMNILRLRISKLCSDPEKTWDENFEELKMCIRDHKNLIELHEIISPVISTTIFLQFTLTVSILGTSLINMLIFAKKFSSILASMIYIFAVVVEIFPTCYLSNCLFWDSNQLHHEIFHSSWIEQSPRYRQMLIVFMQRSQVTMEMTAGKIFPISLNSFISIAKFSFSLYTVIKKMGIKERLDNVG